ncbi:MAG: sulfite exporter TauE/SafE family protein [Pseudolabrys sp.]|nr:sulfite exporter TauE/SafE family protein [Pseudolabrys sp.]
MSEVWSHIPVWDVVIFVLTLCITYVIFAAVGFGSSLLAAPLLAHKLPLPTVVSVLALLDFTATVLSLRRLNRSVATRELFRLAPTMILGSAVGVYLLLSLSSKILLLGLGLFAVGYGLLGLFLRTGSSELGSQWAFPFGLVGGIFSGMFGSGGFVYSIYLNHRLQEKNAVRATMTAMTGLSTSARVVMFACVGRYSEPSSALLVLLGIPAAILGLSVGHRITAKLSRASFHRFLCLVLAATGVTLLWRVTH